MLPTIKKMAGSTTLTNRKKGCKAVLYTYITLHVFLIAERLPEDYQVAH
jgi:hypothetical protein